MLPSHFITLHHTLFDPHYDLLPRTTTMSFPIFVQCLLSAVGNPLVSARRMTRHQFRYVSMIFHNQRVSKSREVDTSRTALCPCKMLREGSGSVFRIRSNFLKQPDLRHISCIHMYTSICIHLFQAISNTLNCYFSCC